MRLKSWFRITLIVVGVLAAEALILLVVKAAWILYGIDN